MLGRGKKRRSEQHEEAMDLTRRAAALLPTDTGLAELLYRDAVDLDPSIAVAWFDLGLIQKWNQRWEAAFDCNMRAAELIGEQPEEPVWWNLGIASTALRRWDVARRAWSAFGITVPDGDGPIDGNLGPGVVRLNPDGAAEVVWGRRLDPARIRLDSVPLPESGHRFGDIVLHDGDPRGTRELGGREYAVFNELERWEHSSAPTIQASLSAGRAEELDELIELAYLAGLGAEDWTRGVRALCRRCSEGTPHPEHSHQQLAGGEEHLVGLAGPPAEVESLVEGWARGEGRVVHSLDVVGE